MKKFLTLLFVGILAISCMCACKSNSGVTESSSSSSVESEYALNKTEVSLNIGDTETLILNGANADNVEWETFNETIATVEGGVITALKEGVVNVAAVYEGEVFICRVTVAQVLETVPVLRITNAPKKVAVGDTTVILETSFSDGATAIENVTYTWESQNTSVITVDANGKLTLLKAGSATICVSCVYDGATYTAMCQIEVV